MIVVGVDGSDFSLRAVDWAVDEAARRRRPLRVIHAVAPWLYDTPVDPRVGAVREWLLHGGQEVVDVAVAAARQRDPDVSVDGAVEPGPPAGTLVETARTGAELVVVAGHGMGGAAGLLLGSVALQVVSHARVPTAVVRRSDPVVHGEVVVGVDVAGVGDPSIGFAFEEAALRGVRLRALHAWAHPTSSGPGDMQPLVYDPSIVAAEAARTLSGALAPWRAKFPDVEVVEDVVHGRAVRALSGASASADLLVVGSRGRGGFKGLLLGSVSHALLHHAHCPVVVVPPSH